MAARGLPLVIRHDSDGVFEVGEEAASLLQSLHGNVAVVAIAGRLDSAPSRSLQLRRT